MTIIRTSPLTEHRELVAQRAIALAVIAYSNEFTGWATGTVLFALGAATVYTTLLGVLGDGALPRSRRAPGTYAVAPA